MHAEDRPIHFSMELIHLPVQHDRQALQKLYYELSQTREAAYDSSDFSVPAQPKFHSRRGERTQSILVFAPDRLVIVEEWVDMALPSFLKKADVVATRAMDMLNIPFLAAHTGVIRTTFALTHFQDARVFLLDHACRQEGRIGPHFRRPVATGGLRFVFPETPEDRGALHVTIESYRYSIGEVFVEVKGVFAKDRIDRRSLGVIRDNMQCVRSFITDCIFPYLDQYDTLEEEPI